MTYTPITGPGRISQFLWGLNQQNTFQISYPMALDQPKFWRQPRKGSETVVIGPTKESWKQASDFMASFMIKHIDGLRWSGLAGFQAFLDYATTGAVFSFVPDAVFAPLYCLTNCQWISPFDNPNPGFDANNGTQSLAISFRNPTNDLGLAWR